MSRDVLTQQQIQEVRATNAYEAVERLKAHWLRSTTPTSPLNQQRRTMRVMVYLDGQRVGYVDQLRRVEVAAIKYIQYYTPAEASARWGFGNGGGAILVVTQPSGP
ncbi:MAG: Plug domain-containing protein [Longimicrobiales bacterium]|nr:Plug domain-containing protein [Longimicrobiales bacterium]